MHNGALTQSPLYQLSLKEGAAPISYADPNSQEDSNQAPKNQRPTCWAPAIPQYYGLQGDPYVTSINDSHACRVAALLSSTVVSAPMPVIAEIAPTSAEDMQPIRDLRVPQQQHKLASLGTAKMQALLQVPVVVPC